MKKILVFGIVLALCCSSAFCLPRKASSSPEPAEVSPATVEEPIQNVSSEMLTEATPESESSLTELSEKLESKFFVTGKTLAEIKEAFVQLGEDIDALKEDNRNLNDLLDKKDALKYFTNIGVAFGLEHGFGFEGNIGIRKNHLVFAVGANYLFANAMDMVQVTKHDWSVDNVTLHATVGWEW